MYLLVISIIIFFIIILLFIFYVGKKAGEYKNNNFLNSLKAYELAFNQLLEEIELVCQHNIKVLETKINEIQELVKSADKKCIYADELLSELESAKNELQKKMSEYDSLHAKNASLTEKRLRLEFQSLLNAVNEKINHLEKVLGNLQSISLNISNPALKNNPRGEITDSSTSNELYKQNSLYDRSTDNKNNLNLVSNNSNSIDITDFIKTKFTNDADNYSANTKNENERKSNTDLAKNIPVSHLKSAKTITSLSDRNIDITIDDNDILYFDESKYGQSELNVGSPFYEVVKLSNEGYSVPQIAKLLKLSKADVELILSIFSNSKEYRDIV